MNNNPPNPTCDTDLTDVERVKDAIWSARQDAPNEAYALKMRLSYDEAMRAARAAIVAMQQPIHADEVERAALASLTERFGARAAEYQREFDTSAWREELRVIRAALLVSNRGELEDLKHDLDRYMKIANIECNRAEKLQEALQEIADRPGAGMAYAKGVGEWPIDEADHMANIARTALDTENSEDHMSREG